MRLANDNAIMITFIVKVTKRICKFVVNFKMEFIIILRFMSRKFVSSKFFEKEW